MSYKNIIRLITSISLISFLTGCAVNQVTYDKDGTIIENNTNKSIEQKEIIYKRPVISMQLKNRIRNILIAMSTNDLNKLNQEYIHPTFGFYNLYKIDGIKIFLEQKMIYNIIEEETEEVLHVMSRVSSESSTLKIIEKNVKFDCSPNDDTFYGWNDDGLFLSNKTDVNLLSMMKNLSSYSEQDLQKAEQIKQTSYKVVLTPELSFYLTYIDNNWYITLIDRITTDCSSPKY